MFFGGRCARVAEQFGYFLERYAFGEQVHREGIAQSVAHEIAGAFHTGLGEDPANANHAAHGVRVMPRCLTVRLFVKDVFRAVVGRPVQQFADVFRDGNVKRGGPVAPLGAKLRLRTFCRTRCRVIPLVLGDLGSAQSARISHGEPGPPLTELITAEFALC